MASNWKPTAVPHVYASGTRLAYRIKSPETGKWAFVSSKYVAGQEVDAGRALEKAKRALEAGVEIKPSGAPVTMEEYATAKFFPRRRTTIEDWKSDETRINDHVFPFMLDHGVALGKTSLRDVRTRHLIDCFATFRKKLRPDNGTSYAPKSIWNTYGVVKALFRDAILDELVFDSPCVLDERHLGMRQDKDPEWRETAVYTMEELELLMFSPLIPWDRRVWYALLGLGALRIGEAAALRWRAYDPASDPLGRLLISKSHQKLYTKTKMPRKMPVHPTLAALLAAWKLRWPDEFGRHPQPDDLVVPCTKPDPGRGGPRLPLGAMRTVTHINDKITGDLATLGLRHRRSHDLRATFITQALIDGAKEKHLEACTHTAKNQKAFDLYNRIPWSAKCEAVACLKVRTEAAARGQLIQLATAVGDSKSMYSLENASQPGERPVTCLLPVEPTDRDTSGYETRSTGFEPVGRADGDPTGGASSDDGGVSQEGPAAAPSVSTIVGPVRARSTGNRVTGDLDPTELALSVALDHWRHAQDVEVLCAQLEELLGRLGGGR